MTSQQERWRRGIEWKSLEYSLDIWKNTGCVPGMGGEGEGGRKRGRKGERYKERERRGRKSEKGKRELERERKRGQDWREEREKERAT